MAIVFKTPKSTLNTTSKQIQNLGGDCPPCPEPVLEGKELEYTQNGEYTVTPEQGVDGFSSIDVTVNVPSDVNNQDKTVSPSTSSQSVSADSGYTGLGTVTVNPVTSSIDDNIQPENILSGVTILGVSGTDEGYDAGYTDGETAGHSAGYAEGEADGIVEGIAEQKAKLASVTINQNGTSTREDGWNSVTVNVVPDLQVKTVNPSTSQQVVSPDQGKDGLSSVTVNAVTNAIDANIQAGNIKNGVSILGVTGSYNPQPRLQSKDDINPSTSMQGVSPDPGYDGLSYVGINAVTAAIDNNIQPANILSGVTILGVEGTDEGYDAGQADGYQSGYQTGYDEGYSAGQAECPTPTFEQLDETITENGSYNYSPEADGFDSVDITVNVQPDLEAKTATYVANNTYTITPTAGKDGISQATITVNVPSDINNQNKTVSPSTSQQTVMADNGYSGLGTVTVNAVTAAIDANIVAENILDGVTILGVTGSDLGYDAGYADGYAQGQSECPEPGGCDNTAYVQETITTNGTYTFDPSDYQGDSYDAFDGVEITVNVSGGTVTGDPFWIKSLEDGNTASITYVNDYMIENSYNMEYSLDGTTWTTIVFQRATPVNFSLNTDDVLYLRGNNDAMNRFNDGTSSGRITMVSTKTVDVGGYIASLLNSTNYVNYSYESLHTFAQLFYGSTNSSLKVVDASQLVLPNVTSEFCYDSMFEGCTTLEVPPSLPASVVANYAYHNMFKGCTSLRVAPTTSMRIIGSYGCNGMFYECANLSSVPIFIAKAVSTQSLSYMFYGCSSIQSVPSNMLPSKDIYEHCYSHMFEGCSNLTNAPELPADYFGSQKYVYAYMFKDCASLTTAPILPATTMTSYCYSNMFNGCSSLSEITCLSKSTDGNYTHYYDSWVNGVSATGTFYKNADMSSWTTGNSGIPSGWTVEDYVSA